MDRTKASNAVVAVVDMYASVVREQEQAIELLQQTLRQTADAAKVATKPSCFHNKIKVVEWQSQFGSAPVIIVGCEECDRRWSLNCEV